MGIIFRGKERTPEEYKIIREKEAREWEIIQAKSRRRREQGKTGTPEKPDVKPLKKKDEGEIRGMVTVKHVNEMLNGTDEVSVKRTPEEVLLPDERLKKEAPCKGRVCKPIKEESDAVEEDDIKAEMVMTPFVDVGQDKDTTIVATFKKDEKGDVKCVSTVVEDDVEELIPEECDKILTESQAVDDTKEDKIKTESFSLKESTIGELPGNIADDLQKHMREDLKGHTYKELVRIAQGLDVPAYGKKAELIERILKKQLSK